MKDDNSPRAIRAYMLNASREAVAFFSDLARAGDNDARRELLRRGIRPPMLSVAGMQRVASAMPASLDDEVEDEARRQREAAQRSLHHFPRKRSPE